MAETRAKLAELDPVWGRIRTEAGEAIEYEPLLGGVIHSSILHHKTLESALAYRISLKLASTEMPASFGVHGPGETIRWVGFSFSIVAQSI